MLLGGEEAAVKTGAYYLKGLSDSSNVLVQAGVKGLVGESKAIHDQTRDKYFFGKEYDEENRHEEKVLFQEMSWCVHLPEW